MADELAPVGELVAVDGDELAGLGPRELEAFGGLGDAKAGRQTLETGLRFLSFQSRILRTA